MQEELYNTLCEVLDALDNDMAELKESTLSVLGKAESTIAKYKELKDGE